jgi:uncharacterized membrane protein
LIARGGAVANAASIKKHMPAALMATPVSLLSASGLAAWRDGLLAAGKHFCYGRSELSLQ